jgi:hypothetical protein
MRKDKPPIGLVPKYIWEQQRVVDICEAMLRYAKNGRKLPAEWIIELEEHWVVNGEGDEKEEILTKD